MIKSYMFQEVTIISSLQTINLYPTNAQFYRRTKQKNRTARKQQQIEENQFFEDSEGLLYGPGIAD